MLTSEREHASDQAMLQGYRELWGGQIPLFLD